MISVDAAQEQLLARIAALPIHVAQQVRITDAIGRVLAGDVFAARDHPPFAAAAMDGFAVRWSDIQALPTHLRVVGESHAGKRFSGTMHSGQTVRIFTGAPIPAGADTVVTQEDTVRDSDRVHISGRPDKSGGHVRPAGLDARKGQLLAQRGDTLTPARAGWIAASAVATVDTTPRPRVDLVMCGDELRLPGQQLGEDQIVSTNGLLLAAMLTAAGADVVGADHVVPDDLDVLSAIFANAQAQLIVTAGGASVGARDFVQEAIKNAGGTIEFWKIAMRPGKPLMLGSIGDKIIIGLPGNPVSAFVGATLFAVPAVRALQRAIHVLPAPLPASWLHAWPENGPRADYVRVRVDRHAAGFVVQADGVQDSSMLSVLAHAGALAVVPPFAPAAKAGDAVQIILLNAG
jgi:molybdopterin molybdotransferase